MTGSTGFRGRRRAIQEAGLALLSGLVSVVIAVVALHLTPADLAARWQIGGDDSILHYLLFTNATQQFSFADNPDLGFPHGLNVFFSGQVDASSAVVMSLLALVIHNGFLLLNVFWLLTFVGAGVTGFVFFRALRIRPWMAVLFGVIFSIAPYHFIRIGYGHPFIANYWAVPLVGILMLMASGSELDPFRTWQDRAGGRRSRILRRLLPAVVLGLLVASTGAYYFVFGVVMVGGVWVFAVIRNLLQRDARSELVRSTTALVPLVFFVALELFLLGRGYGQRYAPYFMSRHPGESELYAGKIVNLLEPWIGTGIPFLSKIPRKYAEISPVLTTAEAAGTSLLASFGLLLLGVAVVSYALTRQNRLSATWLGQRFDDPRLRVLAPAMLWALAFFVVTGLGIVVAVVAGPEVRAWSRMSIVLILIGLAVTAILIQEATKRYRIRHALVGLVIVVALFDQVAGVYGAVGITPTHDPEVAAFVASAEHTLPHDCGVVQLPIKSFPDSGMVGAMHDYDEALPYLYTKPGDLRWSYGSIRGTTGWNVFGGATTPARFHSAVDGSHACAIEVDQRGYTADPNGWMPLVKSVAGSTTPTEVSSSKRYLLFALPVR